MNGHIYTLNFLLNLNNRCVLSQKLICLLSCGTLSRGILCEVLTLRTVNQFAFENENRESFPTESFCLSVFKRVINVINLYFKQSLMNSKITSFCSTLLAAGVNMSSVTYPASV